MWTPRQKNHWLNRGLHFIDADLEAGRESCFPARNTCLCKELTVTMLYSTYKLRTEKGFTFVELMVVLAIIAILAAVSIPAYFNYVMRSRQSKAIGELMAIKAAEEQYFVENGAFTTTIGLLRGYASAGTFASAKYTPDSYYQYWITTTGTIRAEGDLNGDGFYGDGWQVSSTDVMAKPEAYTIGPGEGFSFSFLDIF
jgi:prepilin-type N-terminal cleavage/methylation domain-containing protein